MIFFILTFYAITHSPSGDVAATYEGMDQATIVRLNQELGRTVDFVSKSDYDAFVQAHARVPPTAAEKVAAVRQQASEYAVTGVDIPSELTRAVLLLALDEINILRQRDVDRSADVAASTSLADLKTRWAARSALTNRTTSQLKTAVQNKINSGDAD